MAQAAGLVGAPSLITSRCPGQSPAWKTLCSGIGLTEDAAQTGTAARTEYTAVLRSAIKLFLPWARNICLRSCTHVCIPAHSSWEPQADQFSCPQQGCQPSGASWHILQESTHNLQGQGSPTLTGGARLPHTRDAVAIGKGSWPKYTCRSCSDFHCQ